MPAIPVELLFGHLDVTCPCGHHIFIEAATAFVRCGCGREMKVERHAKVETKRKRTVATLFVSLTWREG